MVEDLNRLKVLNTLRLSSGAMFGEVMKAVRLSRGVVAKHLRTLMAEGTVLKDETRRYHITENGEKSALLLEEMIRGKKWMKNISLPNIKLIAKQGYATVTFDGCNENAIRDIYNRFESFVKTARDEGLDVTGILRLCKTKDT